jgi:hypothetical protein
MGEEGAGKKKKKGGESEMRRVVQDENGVPRVVIDDGVAWV